MRGIGGIGVEEETFLREEFPDFWCGWRPLSHSGKRVYGWREEGTVVHEKCPMHEICPTQIHRPRNSCTNIRELSISNPENVDKYYPVDNGK
jgi:hypothetical protein